MRATLARWLYRGLLPLVFPFVVPGWWCKALRRGGQGGRLGERFSLYGEPPEFEPAGAIHIHAVSVGETVLALRLIRAWQRREPSARFVLAVGTATARLLAGSESPHGVRAVYVPFDLRWMVRRYLSRFEPSRIILVEGEVWPNLMDECTRRGVPVSLVNARTSPRSAHRLRRVAAWVRPVFSRLDLVALQDETDAELWRSLGISAERIHVAGGMKFDPQDAVRPHAREDFARILAETTGTRPLILAASTHAGEEVWLARIVAAARPDAGFAVVPRHAERRHEVLADLAAAGFHAVLRSRTPEGDGNSVAQQRVLVVDSTGELRDWMAHAELVLIGKSFLSRGGQNPVEAILAAKPVVAGPHMENFALLARQLSEAGGWIIAEHPRQVEEALRSLADPAARAVVCDRAAAVLARHEGAVARVLDLLGVPRAEM
jgi:3-deoxy-D-manno-octulosonic-acid transferase